MKITNDKFEKILEKKEKISRKERTEREAREIYNYNRYKTSHEKMVNKELNRLERKNKFPKLLKVALAIIIILAAYTKLIQIFPEIQNWILELV